MYLVGAKQQADIIIICTEERGGKLLRLQIGFQILVVSGVVLPEAATIRLQAARGYMERNL